MNENNNTNKSNVVIKSYRIESNHDEEGTYSVEINTSAHTVIYPRAIVAFGISQAIIFPIGVQVTDDNNNVLFNFSLNLQQDQPETPQQTND